MERVSPCFSDEEVDLTTLSKLHLKTINTSLGYRMGYTAAGNASIVDLAKMIIVLTLALFFVCLSLYLWRRKKFPIAQRYPYFVMVEAAFFTILGLVNFLIVIYPLDSSGVSNCRGFLAIVAVGEMISINLITVRIILVIFRDLRTRNLMENENFVNGNDKRFQKSTDFCTGLVKWLFRQASTWFTDYQMAFIITFPVMVISLCNCVLVFSNKVDLQNVLLNSEECYNTLAFNGFILQACIYIYLGICLSLVVILIFQLKDNFGIGTEIRILLAILSIMAILSTCMAHYPTFQTLAVDLFIYNFVVWGLVIPALHCVQLAFPVYLSMKNERRVKARNETNASKSSGSPNARNITFQELSDCLEMLLNNPEGRSLLIEFLQSEFSVENLFFIEACAEFQRLCGQGNHEKLVNHVKLMNDVFISEKAVNSVNISHKVKGPLIIAVESILCGPQSVINPHLFEDAVKEVRTMLVTDSFHRFRFSEDYTLFTRRNSQEIVGKVSNI
jgi:hypothetical protein